MRENFKTVIYSHFNRFCFSLSLSQNSFHLKHTNFSCFKSLTFSDWSPQSSFITFFSPPLNSPQALDLSLHFGSKYVIEERRKAKFLYTVQVRSCINKGKKDNIQKVYSKDKEPLRNRSNETNSNFNCIINCPGQLL